MEQPQLRTFGESVEVRRGEFEVDLPRHLRVELDAACAATSPLPLLRALHAAMIPAPVLAPLRPLTHPPETLFRDLPTMCKAFFKARPAAKMAEEVNSHLVIRLLFVGAQTSGRLAKRFLLKALNALALLSNELVVSVCHAELAGMLQAARAQVRACASLTLSVDFLPPHNMICPCQ